MSKLIKKIIPYLLISLILAGLFSPMVKVGAQESLFTDFVTQAGEERVRTNTQAILNDPNSTQADRDAATAQLNALNAYARQEAAAETTAKSTEVGAFERGIRDGCGTRPWTWFNGCLLLVFYYTYFQLPTFILWVSALLFNALITISLSPEMTSTSSFISNAWAVVRDLSNIFFILVLLYVAIQTILGMGHETKKIIVKVIVIALLINFSMFFTKVVIDTSNILALVFYNKLDMDETREYSPSTPYNEKDVTGQMYAKFDATRLIDKEFMESLKTSTVQGKTVKADQLPFALTLGMIAISGSIMLWAAYAFFVSGFAFLGRLIELWVLIIFSPFAFMSFTIPFLSNIEYIGWANWSKRLLATSFMAPIFMFFLYLIFLLLQANIFGNFIKTGGGFVVTILGVIIPALIIIGLLLKATKFAVKGGGQFGEMLLKGGAMLTGLAIGAVSGGTSLAVGGLAAKAASSKGLQEAAKATGFRGVAGRMALRTANYGAKASFDVRNVPGVRTLTKAGGLDLGKAKEGGYEKMRADKVKKRQERAKQLEVREDETLKQNLNKVETDLQNLLNENSAELSEIDKLITKKRETLRDTTARFGGGTDEAKQAGLELQNVKDRKKALKDGKDYLGDKDLVGNITGVNAKNYSSVNAGTYVDAGGVIHTRTINHMEDVELVERKHEIENENRERQWAYADRIEGNKIMFWRKTGANREAAHKIRMKAKIESKGGDDKGHGGGVGHAPAPAPTPAPGGGGGGHGGGGHGSGGGHP